MVTMVYSHLARGASASERILYWIAAMTAAGELFRGPRSFRSWPMAVAYANLPASVGITLAPRRRVYRLPTGQWAVIQTTAPRGAR